MEKFTIRIRGKYLADKTKKSYVYKSQPNQEEKTPTNNTHKTDEYVTKHTMNAFSLRGRRYVYTKEGTLYGTSNWNAE